MIIRIDDFSPNTNVNFMRTLLEEITLMPNVGSIMVCVNLLAKTAAEGSVYPNPPFKEKKVPFFYDVDKLLNPLLLDDLGMVEIASHGLLHVDHSQITRDAQEMSIVSSCNIIGTDTFVPPFNKYNYLTQEICEEHGIELIKPEEGWRSLDYEAGIKDEFDSNHELWYMHPWRWSIRKFRERVSSKVNRFVRTDIRTTSNGHKSKKLS